MYSRKAGKNGALHRTSGAALAAGVACCLALAPAQASAGACEKTKRNQTFSSTVGVSAHTVVRNKTAAAYYVVDISRGATSKSSGVIGPGSQVAKLSNVQQEGIMNVSVKPTGQPDTTACSYKIRVSGSDSWWLIDRSDGNLCEGAVRIECTKTFHPDRLRWNTILEITG